MERLSEVNLGQEVLRADSLASHFLSTICLLPDSEYNVTSHLKKINNVPRYFKQEYS